jgi:phage shock protein C
MDRAVRQLTRSRKERVFAGICGGMAIYLGLDPVLVRVLFVALTMLSNGVGIVVYVLAWFIVPLEREAAAEPYIPSAKARPKAALVLVGAFLILSGLIALTTSWFPAFWEISDIKWAGPAVLVIAGIAMIIWQRNQTTDGDAAGPGLDPSSSGAYTMQSSSPQNGSQVRRLVRVREGRKVAGVCTGFGTYFNVDPTIIRLIWLALFLIAGTGLLLYIICWIAMPLEPENPLSAQHVPPPPPSTTSS